METFEEVLEQYEPMIYACIRKLRIYKNYTEFIQAGRVGLWQAWKRYDQDRGEFAPYAYRSIYGTMLDELKKSVANEQNLVPTKSVVIERIMSDSDDRTFINEFIDEAISHLKSTDQLLIQLLFIKGYTLDEVAHHMNISKSNLKKKRQRILKKLKERMKPGT
ncbi:MAG: sigma-70 family RNA polymerase sigma factor [Paenisporosarcina sp.]